MMSDGCYLYANEVVEQGNLRAVSESKEELEKTNSVLPVSGRAEVKRCPKGRKCD